MAEPWIECFDQLGENTLSTRYLIGCKEARIISTYQHSGGKQVIATATATASTSTVVVITVPISSAAATGATDEGGEVSYVHQFRRLLRDNRGDHRLDVRHRTIEYRGS